MYIDFNKESNKKSSKLKVDDHAKISKYRNIFEKCYVSNQSEEVFVIKKKLKMLFFDLKGEEFYKKQSQKAKQKRIQERKSN